MVYRAISFSLSIFSLVRSWVSLQERLFFVLQKLFVWVLSKQLSIELMSDPQQRDLLYR